MRTRSRVAATIVTLSVVLVSMAAQPTAPRPVGLATLARAAITGGAPIVRALPNDNRTPAGTYAGDTLLLRLTVKLSTWHILGDDEPAFTLLAFAEEGKPATIPGPLIRVRVGTPVRVTIRNPLDDTLVVRGFGERASARDSLVVLPGATTGVSYVARHEGTYLY
jgi:FtsP/CotA-like multicopper oxidase with cupredoxin domain